MTRPAPDKRLRPGHKAGKGIATVHPGDYVEDHFSEAAEGMIVPTEIKEQVEYDVNGKRRPDREIAWFFRMLECGSAIKATQELWPNYSDKNQRWKSWSLKKKWQDLLAQAMTFQRAYLEPLAFKTYEHIMERALDPVNQNDAKMLMAGGKAASDLLDRGAQPRNIALKGVDMTLAAEKAEQSYREIIDKVVALIGIDSARSNPLIKDYKLHRDYFEEKWPLKQIAQE